MQAGTVKSGLQVTELVFKVLARTPGLAFDRSVRPIQDFWVLDIAQHCLCSCESAIRCEAQLSL